MNDSITDLELSFIVSTEVGDLYGKAIEFAKSIPDYSLLQYRHIIDLMLTQIADKYDVVFDTSDLITRIDTLFDSQLINNSTKDSFHQVRILGNKGAHIERKKPNKDDSARGDSEQKNKMVELVEKGRKHLISIFEDYLLIEDPSYRIGEVVLLELSIQEFQQVVAQGILSNNFEAKMKAGLLVDNAANEQQEKGTLVVSSNEEAHIKSMKATAASLFDACCTLSADITLSKELYGHLDDDAAKEAYVQKHADPEALFNYVKAAEMAPDVNLEKVVARLKATAERGFEPAQLFYAEELFCNQAEYDEALKYLEMCIDGVDPIVYLSLYMFYKDKDNPHYDPDLAFSYLERAVVEEARNAKAVLALEYFQGDFIAQDTDMAYKLAKEAAMEGCKRGILLSGVIGTHLFAKQYVSMEPEKKVNPHTKQPKLGPNEECNCGSGKKFKKCCKGKPLGPLPHELFY